MKHRTAAALAATLLASGLLASAPAAHAGCLYGGGLSISRCDDPVQPDGTWQRCVETHRTTTDASGSSIFGRERTCRLMGPGQFPLGIAFGDPPTHID
jgi:hypothetical protein